MSETVCETPLVLTFPQAKLSVYPEPDKPITVVETRTELERQMGLLRQKFQHYTGDMFRSLRSGIDSVVNAEHRVEVCLNLLMGLTQTACHLSGPRTSLLHLTLCTWVLRRWQAWCLLVTVCKM